MHMGYHKNRLRNKKQNFICLNKCKFIFCCGGIAFWEEADSVYGSITCTLVSELDRRSLNPSRCQLSTRKFCAFSRRRSKTSCLSTSSSWTHTSEFGSCRSWTPFSPASFWRLFLRTSQILTMKVWTTIPHGWAVTQGTSPSTKAFSCFHAHPWFWQPASCWWDSKSICDLLCFHTSQVLLLELSEAWPTCSTTTKACFSQLWRFWFWLQNSAVASRWVNNVNNTVS